MSKQGRARKFCSDECRHAAHNEKRRRGQPKLIFCIWPGCEAPLRPRQRKYCSRRCAKRQAKVDARERGATWVNNSHGTVRLSCGWCGSIFEGFKNPPSRDGWSRFCSAHCQAEARRWSHRKAFTCDVPWTQCKKCDARFLGRGFTCKHCKRRPDNVVKRTDWLAGYCVECGSSFVSRYSVTRFCSRACSRAVKARNRQAAKRTNFVERVFRVKVFRRDKWTCGICGKPTGRKWVPNDPQAPTLDHIVPIAKGGEHSYANTQCAHALCNSRKQDRIDDEVQLALC